MELSMNRKNSRIASELSTKNEIENWDKVLDVELKRMHMTLS
ncbi:hypothetical protein SAMN05216283_101946 [Sunxiuqinia elliptica]|uniref:Uncharacterized protein n=1 Tax=Sunxiuqinia elliptica TaxID=655355 RepID=A0A1I2D646_9BACT|nr:hypothetical protein SAMN05216283_101946 [Sunxiuqinia elliptica]